MVLSRSLVVCHTLVDDMLNIQAFPVVFEVHLTLIDLSFR